MNTNTAKIKDKKGNLIEVYENQISFYLDEYTVAYNMGDLKQASQSQWNAILYYIYRRAFEGTNQLKAQPYQDYTNESGKKRNLKHTNNNSYDLDEVEAVLKVYIDLCFTYDKEISVYGFSRLTGISREIIYSWGNDNTCRGFDILKELQTSREESLSDRLYSSKASPVGVLGILNHWYGWNMGQPHGETKDKPRSIEQIQKEYLTDQKQIKADTQKGDKTNNE